MTILTFIIVLGVLIFVHELGHFLVAKRAGVGVLKFSLGFGPKLLGVKRGETEYLISALPLGGYVKMVGEDPGDDSPEAQDEHRSFAKKSVGTRARIILAGPLANAVLPILIFWAVFTVVGQPYVLPVVGGPEPGSPSAQAGLQAGDRIVAVDGRAVDRWDEVASAIQDSQGRPMILRVARDGRTFEATLTPAPARATVFGRDMPTWDVGLHPLILTRLGQVVPGLEAARAGLTAGDLILSVNGRPVQEWEQLADAIHASPNRPVLLRLERDGRQIEISVTPRGARQPGGEKEIGLIGIGPAPETAYRRLNPVSGLWTATQTTAEWSVAIVVGIAKLVQGKIAADTIGGPILIYQMSGEVAHRGAMELLTFIAVLSINLAILNLLPIPVLDGGHLLFAVIERLRGKPVSLRKREIAQQVGMVLLAALMLFATYNDIFRLIRWTGRP